MGRDHTIFALVPGFVRFYRKKHLSGFRRYVGIVQKRGETLPRDVASLGRSRYFGLKQLDHRGEELHFDVPTEQTSPTVP